MMMAMPNTAIHDPLAMSLEEIFSNNTVMAVSNSLSPLSTLPSASAGEAPSMSSQTMFDGVFSDGEGAPTLVAPALMDNFPYFESPDPVPDFVNPPTTTLTSHSSTAAPLDAVPMAVPDMGNNEFFDFADTINLDALIMDTQLEEIYANASPHVTVATHPSFFSQVTSGPATESPATATGAELKRKRRPKMKVSEDIRATARYQERRRKNTLCAKRNREAKRQLAQQSALMLPTLTVTNANLRFEADMLRSELSALIAYVRERAALMS